jgi:hypothetical protein
MPNQLQKVGAQPSKPARYGVLWHNNFYLGIVTQRNPLHSFLQHIEEEFYGSQPCLADGLNTEISTSLTLVRRPGSTVYNSQTFPAITRFYENRTTVYNATQTNLSENIQVLCDTVSAVYDCTGPSTKVDIFNKTAGAGSTYFQSVGNTLYFTDGPDQKKYLTPQLVWAANQVFNLGSLIVDTNGNVQVAETAYTLDIESVLITQPVGSSTWYVVVQFSSPIPWASSTTVKFEGMTGYTNLNGNSYTLQGPIAGLPLNPNQGAFLAPTSAYYGPSFDTGTGSSQPAVTQNESGGSVPTWNATIGGNTNDGNLRWTNYGSRVENWSVPAPLGAPSITPNPNDRQWTPNTTFSLGYYYTVLDSNGNVEAAVLGSGPTGVSVPVWSTQTPENSGGSGTTSDGGYVWYNCGPPSAWMSNFAYTSGFFCVVDSNNNYELSVGSGTSGLTVPSWNPTPGGTTTDGTVTWLNVGPAHLVSSGSRDYAFSYHSIDGSVSTASPESIDSNQTPVLGPNGQYVNQLTGIVTSDSQIDQIWIWGTVQGGSSLFLLDTIPNPEVGTGGTWTYYDYYPDTLLNELVSAPIDDQNNPPPPGLVAIAYHLNRIWGAVGNIVYNSQTSGITGNPYTAWDPEDFFVFPATVVRLFPTLNGLIVFTNSGIYVIQGTGTSSSPFFSTPFLQNIGLGNYDGFTVNGAIAYFYTTDNQVVSMDPSSGLSEVGFPIGDQFGPSNGTNTFFPSSAHLTWNYAGSQEKALYVSDFSGSWWRMLPTPSPETGSTWCPRAVLSLGFSAVQSVETSPGVHNLLIGPNLGGGPILLRSQNTFTDNGASYSAYATIGSIVLAQPGQLAYAKMITTDSVIIKNILGVPINAPLTLEIQLDEIAPLSSGYFENMAQWVPDPTQLSASKSVYAQRFYLSQTQQPAVCRHLQILVNFGTDTFKDELLSITVFGSFEQEM